MIYMNIYMVYILNIYIWVMTKLYCDFKTCSNLGTFIIVLECKTVLCLRQSIKCACEQNFSPDFTSRLSNRTRQNTYFAVVLRQNLFFKS